VPLEYYDGDQPTARAAVVLWYRLFDAPPAHGEFDAAAAAAAAASAL